MQGILSFDNSERKSKRRKAIRACQRCKDSKKRCGPILSSQRCRRCDENSWTCSFEESPDSTPVELGHTNHPRLSYDSRIGPPPGTELCYTQYEAMQPEPLRSFDWPSPVRSRDERGSARHSQVQHDGVTGSPADPIDGNDSGKELRYATMLMLMENGTSAPKTTSYPETKLISGTNPLSALLRKDLKHKIVTNSCSFRTPDPVLATARPALRQGVGIHSCNWEDHCRVPGVTEARIQYLRATGCFKLPPSTRCAELLEIFFTYIHPMLPVIDRKEFLSRYYGADEPPPLIILHAVFLAASRYALSEGRSIDGVPEIRSHCDELHAKVRALIDVDIMSDRTAVIQAALISSLHWEGREGLNSAVDSLSLAVRACQEMGLHRKTTFMQIGADKTHGNELLNRRIWWSAYILDRFNAAQEGTPFLIHEGDCDAEPLTEEDLAGEDRLTIRATLINQSLALVIEDTVRSLYAPGQDHITLFSERGVHIRERLSRQLDQLAFRVKDTLIYGKEAEKALFDSPSDVSVLCGTILLIHLDAVRILVHRPFILYPDPSDPNVYASRDVCRVYAVDIVSRLNSLLAHDLVRFSWPFTVYAVVNSLLIFWYDVSSPPATSPTSPQRARQDYASVVKLLRVMGNTWWAAAAKHKLAQALARAVDDVRLRGRHSSAPDATGITGINLEAVHGNPLTPLSATTGQSSISITDWQTSDIFAGCDSDDYWTSLGLDFDLDVAGNIFSIEQPAQLG